MQDARPSATALRVAIRRAAHQLVDNPRVFDDPLALAILGAEAAEKLKAESGKEDTRLARLMRAFMAVRSRFAEDELARAIARGASQYALLGAGLDTFAYRNPYGPEALRVFEVDHPATQAWKLRKLAASGIPVPTTVTYAPVDFETQTLAEGLRRAGFDFERITFFSWLGVTTYLTEDAFAATVRFVASMPPGSGVVFDYAIPRASLGWFRRLAFDALARRVAALGEPFKLFFEPQALREQLQGTGLRNIVDLSAEDINARYFSNRSDKLRLSGGMAHLVSAEK